MAILTVPNATLNYTVVGKGPVLLCIPGVNGEEEFAEDIRLALVNR